MTELIQTLEDNQEDKEIVYGEDFDTYFQKVIYKAESRIGNTKFEAGIRIIVKYLKLYMLEWNEE